MYILFVIGIDAHFLFCQKIAKSDPFSHPKMVKKNIVALNKPLIAGKIEIVFS